MSSLGAVLDRFSRRGRSERAAAAYPSEPPARRAPADVPGGPGIPSPDEVPGVDADRPTQIPAAGWKQVLRRAWAEAKEDNVPLLSAGVAFYAFLALFPALIAAVTLYGLVADPAQVQEQVDSLSRALPEESATLISDQLTEVTSGSERALGIGLAVSLLGALFTASGGIANLMKAVNLAYDEKETRGFLKVRGTALLLTLGAVVFMVVAVGLVAVVPAVMDELGLGAAGRVLVQVLRWGGLVGFVLLALAVVYRYAPDRDNPRFAWVGIGSAVATVLWILGSAGFSLYVSNFGKYGETYGALAGVVVLMLWLFLTSYIVLLGAEINSETEQQTAKDTTQGPELPMGERRAVKADTVAAEPR